MTTPIKTVDDVVNVPTIGKGIRERIDYFLRTGDPHAEKGIIKDQSQQRVLAELMQVPFMGPTIAGKLVEAGCKSVEEVLRRPKFLDMLLPKQKTGMQFHQQLKRPVTQKEAEAVKNFIKESISPDYQILICGGHRRRPTDTAVDCVTILLTHPSQVYVMIPTEAGPRDSKVISLGRRQDPFRPKDGYTKKDEQIRSQLLMQIIPRLQDRGFLAETLKRYKNKWKGIARIPQLDDGEPDKHVSIRSNRKEAISHAQGRYVALEINLAPEKSLGAALIALTGDMEFNRTIQKQASKMGMLLDEYGLWKWIPYNSTNESSDNSIPKGSWRLLPSHSEESIFAELGMEYVPPDRRSYGHLVGKKYSR